MRGDGPAGGHQPLIEVKGGLKVHVRQLVPDDRDLLHEAFAQMSERSVYFRFFSPLKVLPEALARRLAEVDGRNRLAMIATSHRPHGRERILGVARYDRVPETPAAEVAVAVIDEVQRRGVGSVLLSRLAGAARGFGIETFTLIVLPENQSMLGLLRRLGWIHRARFQGGVYEITFEIPAVS